MKILEVANALNPLGGSETFSVNFCLAAKEKSNLLLVVLRNAINPVLLQRLTEGGVRFVVLDKRRHVDFAAAKQLRRIIKEFKPDVIHTENNALTTVYLATRLMKKTPVFHTVHLLPQYEASPKILGSLYGYLFRKRFAVPVAIAPEIKDAVKSFYRLKYDAPLVLNGIMVERFSNSLPLSSREYSAVVIGRFEKQKNHQYVIKLFQDIHARYSKAVFALAGNGTDFEKWKNYIESNNLEYIKMLGLVSDIPSLLKNSKIVLLCSIHEANPLTLLEGMASGCVVVSSPVGGVPSIVREGENGFLVSLDDENGFATRITDIDSNPLNYQTISDNNRIYAKRFGCESMIDQYLSLFENKVTKQ